MYIDGNVKYYKLRKYRIFEAVKMCRDKLIYNRMIYFTYGN